jgi:hypothetical protein
MWQINLGPDNVEWLDEARINSAVAELRSMPAGAKLLEANRCRPICCSAG